MVADIIELIMADHDRIRRLLSAVDDAARYQHTAGPGWPLAPVWRRSAELIEPHFAAEEEICYLPMAGTGSGAIASMRDALADHDDIREAIAEAGICRCGSPGWWLAVSAACRATLDHLAREERQLLSPFSARATPRLRNDLGQDWVQFTAARRRDAAPAQRRRAAAPAGYNVHHIGQVTADTAVGHRPAGTPGQRRLIRPHRPGR